jgi:hypothetical protein
MKKLTFTLNSLLSFLTLVFLITPAVASDSSIKSYQIATNYCAGQNVKKLDDGISSAEVVADVMLDQCRNIHIDLWKIVIRGKSLSWIEGYHRAQLKQFTAYVLMNRTGHVE